VTESVRTPPPGLTRAERRDWSTNEALRIAALQQQSLTGFRAVRAIPPPHGLGGAGRRAWRAADKERRAGHVIAEAARSEADRALGAVVLMVLVGIVIALRVLLGGGDPVPAPTAPATAQTPAHTTLLPGRGE
jgi:hypothetical protein